MPSGYSSLGGQVKNPIRPALLDDRGIPVVQPGGSSSGSAVAVAAGLCAAAIGTETSGLAAQPRDAERPGHGEAHGGVDQPRRHHPDRPTARTRPAPLTRTVRDAAILLNVLARRDPLDPATEPLQRPDDCTAAALDKDGAEGRAHRRAERSRRSAQRSLFRQACRRAQGA